jgi:transcriptional regulator with XRE-family HTH domain
MTTSEHYLNIGSNLQNLRMQAGITQLQLAQGAGLEQSRISRIEKGDIAPSSADIEAILGHLASCNCKAAADFQSYLESTWRHVERPAFDNPQRPAIARAESTLEKISQFIGQAEHPWPLKRQIERQKAAVENWSAFLGQTSHQIAFVGEIGVGKSTAISFLFGLLEPASGDGKKLDRVVLEAGGGRTTICEVQIRPGPAYGIMIQPQSEAELQNLVEDFCAGIWLRSKGSDAEGGDKVGVSEEVQRALRNMSALTVKRERKPDGKNVYRDQALELAATCSSEEEFRARVLERTSFEKRTRREIWMEDGGSKNVFKQLREAFRDVNNGRVSDAPLPASIDIIVPSFGRELAGLDITVVDTKGMDEVALRADIDARLKDLRTHVVLCSTFNQAPMASTQMLLDNLRNTHGQQLDAGKVSILALPRPGEALAVKDDTGEPAQDDADGYDLKRDQILRQLGAGEAGVVTGVPIYFFNAHDDDPAVIRRIVFEEIGNLRRSVEERLLAECAAADEIIENHEQQAFTSALKEVADRLGKFLDAHPDLGSRVRPVHQELIQAMGEIRYASTIWAMTRRNGDYYNFSAIHHVGAGNARDALLRSKNWFERLQGQLDSLKKDAGLALAAKTIAQIEVGARTWKRSFAEAARLAASEVYREPLESDWELWRDCAAQWGRGAGFKSRVEGRVLAWFENHTDLNDELEQIMANAWEKHVLDQLARLVSEKAEHSDDQAAGGNVVHFKRRG